MNKIRRKKGIIISIILLVGNILYAQDISASKVPTPVLSKFTQMFPKSQGGHWKKKGDNYESKVTLDNVKKCVVIDHDGNVIKIVSNIKSSEIPQPVNDYVKNNYPNQKITSILRTTYADDRAKYEVDINETRLCIDKDGMLLACDKQKDEL